MENLNNITSSIATAINDRVYTTLLDEGFDPGVAYQRAFNSDVDLFGAEFATDVSYEDAIEELEAWVPSV